AWYLSAGVQDGGIETGLAALLEEATRVQQHGFLSSELARAKDRARARIERLYAERGKLESDNFAQEYVRHVLTAEPAPGGEAEYARTEATHGGITLAEVAAITPVLMHDSGRVVLATAPDKTGSTAPTEAALRGVLAHAAAQHPAAWVDSMAGKR